MIICSQCGGTLKDNERVCGECGARTAPVSMSDTQIASPSARPQPPINHAVYAQARASVTPVTTNGQIKSIIWIAVTLGLLVLVIITVVGFSISKKTNDTANFTANSNSRIAYSKFNGVHVRDAPNSNATVITDLQKNQAVRVVRESTNYDSVFIQRLNKTVTDDWSEIQVDSRSAHGWIFSGFIR